MEALQSDPAVKVEKVSSGWFFDGPSEDTALIFYPGGKVEETAYAPLLHRLAEEGVDTWLVKMPFRLAVFGKDKAEKIREQYIGSHVYIGGHSLGGVMASAYAAEHGPDLEGVILLASYPAGELPGDLDVLSVVGSQDGVVDSSRMEEARKYITGSLTEEVIEGGNHAQFGNYGVQAGDGEASVSAEEQQRQTVESIKRFVTDQR